MNSDLGRPIAYTAVREGISVHDVTGARVGVVEYVVADDGLDLFEGLIVHTTPLPGEHRFADADQVDELRERGVRLKVPQDELHDPDPARRPAPQPDEPVENPLEARLRRAWDWLTEHLRPRS